MYMARKTPISALKRVVRAQFEPKEYPSSMERMYIWTPDECIPEFYTDASCFSNPDSPLSDICLPAWCQGDAHEFIRWHRSRLESEHVSLHIHKWIDLNFGVALQGQLAKDNLNVVGRGFTQVFHKPHPCRTTFNINTAQVPKLLSPTLEEDAYLTKILTELLAPRDGILVKGDGTWWFCL